jgi:23S rRNA (guanine745-N1)-methyltransferase
MLLCPVRDCHLALTREPRRLFCPRGHSFDVARSGYVNLLQPQERRSKQPGDTTAAVNARRRLHDRGITAPLLSAIAEFSQAKPLDIVLDAGCGEGFYLGGLASRTNCAGYGIDISIAAIDLAARRYPECQWIVGNADRFVPLADASVSLVVSITARMNAGEFRRVLASGGRLLVVPSTADLQEVRGAGRDRVGRTVQDFAVHFTLLRQQTVTTTAHLDADSVQDVLLSIYRPMQAQPLAAMRVTFSLDLLLFGPA